MPFVDCTLRDRMKRAPLLDAPRLTRNVETAAFEMWRHWYGNGDSGKLILKNRVEESWL
jgi:hypothetical protein